MSGCIYNSFVRDYSLIGSNNRLDVGYQLLLTKNKLLLYNRVFELMRNYGYNIKDKLSNGSFRSKPKFKKKVYFFMNTSFVCMFVKKIFKLFNKIFIYLFKKVNYECRPSKLQFLTNNYIYLTTYNTWYIKIDNHNIIYASTIGPLH